MGHVAAGVGSAVFAVLVVAVLVVAVLVVAVLVVVAESERVWRGEGPETDKPFLSGVLLLEEFDLEPGDFSFFRCSFRRRDARCLAAGREGEGRAKERLDSEEDMKPEIG
jgi:hypothetical protein